MIKKNSVLITLIAMITLSTFVMAQTGDMGVRRVLDSLGEENVPVMNQPTVPQQMNLDEGIKTAITQYFKWLNHAETEGALSALRFKPLSMTPEGEAFLNRKNEVLQVVDFSYQINAVQITNRTSEIEFVAAVFDKDSGTVKVEVVERSMRKYAYFDEPSVGETVHTIQLHNPNAQWEVIDDTIENATDALPNQVDAASLIEDLRKEAKVRRSAEKSQLRGAGITDEYLSNERLELAKQGLDPEQIEEQMTVIVNSRMNTASEQLTSEMAPDDAMPQMNANRPYNRDAARRYIDDWWNGRNAPPWGKFDNLGGDCTNWVSQIMNAGGIPEDKAGSYQWYWDNMNPPRTSAPYSRSSSWAGVKELWDYVQGNSNNNGTNGPQGRWWTTSSGLPEMMTGDFIQLYDGSKWYHTYGVYDGKWVNLKPFLCFWCKDDWRYKVRVTSHQSNRHHDDLDVAASGRPTRRYFHVVGWRQ